MISDAVRIGQSQQQLGQKKVTDVMDIIYKSALIQDMNRRADIGEITSEARLTEAQTKLAESMRKAPLDVPGLGQIGFEEWKALDTKTKAYSYYAYDAKQRGEQVMPYNEWQRQTDSPTAHDLYSLAKDDPEFQEWLTKYRESGATRISVGEKVETKKALSQVEKQEYFTDPKGGLQDDIGKHLNSEEVQNRLFTLESGEREIAKVREKENYTVGKIKAAGGKIVNSKLDGRDFVWTVEWPNGDTTEVRVGN